MDQKFDVAVIGTGTAATGIALACAEQRQRVAVIDRRPYGGTCALRGCDPKKVMVATTSTVDRLRRLTDADTLEGAGRVNWSGLQAFKRTFTDPVPRNKENKFREAGIETLHGSAEFIGSNELRVGSDTLRAKRIVIASGSEPIPLPIEGPEHLASSDEFLEMEQLPEHITLVGGGYIGFEFAHIAARAGARVTLLNRGERVLKGFDPDLVELLVGHTRALGIEVLTGHEVRKIEPLDARFKVVAHHDGSEREIVADRVFHSGGRVPAVADLNLDAGGIAHEDRKLSLNEYLQSTSNPDVYAAGDVAPGGFPLTPVAGLEAQVVADNLLHGNRTPVRYPAIPSGVFTTPPLGRVGALEEELKGRGVHYQKSHQDAHNWQSAARVNETAYAFKVLSDPESGRLLGAHVLGPGAEELINLFALAMQRDLTVEALRRTTMLYPTSGSDLYYMLP